MHAFLCFNCLINKSSTATRENSLKEKIKQQKLQRVPFVITYNLILPSIPKLLKNLHTILEASEKCTEVFKNVPLVSYRRGRNLNDMLCSKRMPPQKDTNKEKPNPSDHSKKKDYSQLKPSQCPECGLVLKNEKGLKFNHTSKHRRKQNATTSPGFWPCNSDTRYETCKTGLFQSTITNSENDKTHQIKQPLTCKSKNICYLINCKHFNQQYTGETKRKFHLRLNSHTV